MGTKVHCECSSTLKASEIVLNKKCQEFNTASGSHCKGPFTIDTKIGTYYMGAGSLNSAYSVDANPSGTL